jgi:hypothetical protein
MPELTPSLKALPKVFSIKEAVNILGIPDSAKLRMLLGEWRAAGMIERINKTYHRRKDI